MAQGRVRYRAAPAIPIALNNGDKQFGSPSRTVSLPVGGIQPTDSNLVAKPASVVHGFDGWPSGGDLSTGSDLLREFHMHLVSDATGETVISVARACAAQFDEVRPIEHFWNLVRTQRQLSLAIEGITDHPGIVLFTLVDKELRTTLEQACRNLQIPLIPILDPILVGLASYLGLESKAQPGRQHTMNDEYFGRLDAMDFALSHDDGQLHSHLYAADVILVGVSRTSKTPTCIYLANRGIKAANVPYVPSAPIPDALLTATAPLVVGLTEDPERLVSIRRNRLRSLNQPEISSYTDLEDVRAEVAEARRFYTRMGWPVIDVTRRSIEETAAEIIKILARRNASQEAAQT